MIPAALVRSELPAHAPVSPNAAESRRLASLRWLLSLRFLFLLERGLAFLRTAMCSPKNSLQAEAGCQRSSKLLFREALLGEKSSVLCEIASLFAMGSAVFGVISPILTVFLLLSCGHRSSARLSFPEGFLTGRTPFQKGQCTIKIASAFCGSVHLPNRSAACVDGERVSLSPDQAPRPIFLICAAGSFNETAKPSGFAPSVVKVSRVPT